MIAEENLIAEENMIAGMGIDVEIRIIVVVLKVVCAQVYVELTRNVDRLKSRSGWSGSS